MKGINIIAAAASALLLVGCSSGEHSADEIRDRGSIRIAVQESEQLYSLAEYISDELGVKPELIPTEKETALDMVYNGTADAAVGFFSKSENPGIAYGMTIPFYSENIYAVCRAEDFLSAAADLDGRLIGAEAALPEGTARAAALLSSGETLYCTDSGSAAQMLTDCELDAFICLESSAEQLVSVNENLRCSILPDMAAEQYCVIVLNDNTQLYGEINGAIGKYLTGGNTDGIF